MLSRRDTLRSAIAGLAAVSSACRGDAAILTRGTASGDVPYGAAIRVGLLSTDAEYRQSLIDNCDVIVTEGGLLWYDIRPNRDSFLFDGPDAAASFAKAYDMQMRGHTLVWYGVMPEWTETIATATEAKKELTSHIQRVVDRYRGIIQSWNVINEALVDDPSGPEDLRPSIWQRRLGADHLDFALRVAHEADPSARLVINDYGIESKSASNQRKRIAFAALVSDLVKRGAPLHGVGIQGHLKGEREVDTVGMTAFARQMKALGLEVLITELDVMDNLLAQGNDQRDAIVADRARDLLSAVAQGAPLGAILTWGISDKYTWAPMYCKRADGLPNRPLPLDRNFSPKPLMKVISQFRHARA